MRLELFLRGVAIGLVVVSVAHGAEALWLDTLAARRDAQRARAQVNALRSEVVELQQAQRVFAAELERLRAATRADVDGDGDLDAVVPWCEQPNDQGERR